MAQLVRDGVLDDGYRILEAIPPPGVTCLVQGEFDGVHGRVTYVNKPMRPALEESQVHFHRVNLLGHVGPRYYSELMEIVEMFPGHVIEFAIYDTPLGKLQRHMIIWEVRMY